MENKVVWLTGSASGVGKYLTDAFIKRGYRVVATDINIAALQQEASSHDWPKDQTLIAQLDVTDANQWHDLTQQVISRFGQIDILLNIAGYLMPGYIHETSENDVHRHIDINVKGVIFGSRIAAQTMVQQKTGHIINIASLAGIAPIPGIALYSASKFAVRGFSLALAQELKKSDVKVSVICPDAIQTPMLSLQENYEEAALTFSGAKTLTVEDIGHTLFNQVLPRKPLEVALPASRGWLAKLGSAFPGLSALLANTLRQKGLKKQAIRKAKRT